VVATTTDVATLVAGEVGRTLDRLAPPWPLRPPVPPPLRVQVYRYACINGWTTAHAEPNRNDPGDQRGHCPTCGNGPCRLDGRLCRRCRRQRRLPVKVLA